MTDAVGRGDYELRADTSQLAGDFAKAEQQAVKSGEAVESAFGKKAAGGVDQASRATAGLSREADGLGSRVSQMARAGGFQSALLGGLGLGAGLAMFSAVTAGIRGVTDAIGDAIAAGAEEEASMERLHVALEANAKGWDGNREAVEDWLTASMRATAFADDEQRTALISLVGATKDLSEAQGLLGIAMDLARAKQMDLKTSADIITRVYAGNLGTLSRYGIVVRKGADSTEALAAIQALAAGQAEAYADTNEAAGVKAEQAWGEASEAIGMRLGGLKRVFDDVSRWAAESMADGVEALGDLADAVGDVVQRIDDWALGRAGLPPEIREIGEASGFTADQLLRIANQLLEADRMTERLARSQQTLDSAIPVDHIGEAGRQYQALADELDAAVEATEEAIEKTPLWVRVLEEARLEEARLMNAAGARAAALREGVPATNAAAGATSNLGAALAGVRERIVAMADLELNPWAGLSGAFSPRKMLQDLRRELNEANKEVRAFLEGGGTITDAKGRDLMGGIQGSLQRLLNKMPRVLELDSPAGEVMGLYIGKMATKVTKLEDSLNDEFERLGRKSLEGFLTNDLSFEQMRSLFPGDLSLALLGYQLGHRIAVEIDRGVQSVVITPNVQEPRIPTPARTGRSSAPYPGGWDGDPSTPWPRATGGWTMPGSLYRVNEHGLESFFRPNGMGYVLDAAATSDVLRAGMAAMTAPQAGGSTNVVHVTVQAGGFLGFPEDAQRLGRAITPIVRRELDRLAGSP